ncbi:LysR family transcriptional regulator [Tomitella gaofuii]|uniref:LysR family transcriptional regulator n=1 Tax=Tomitella gaofuii TaxID=2760083 RepID=UPI0015FC0D32|nr:LysR family transcriptional regulator [Tomitella gaofuii]
MSSFDLNLTRVFVLLYETRSVTLSARALHLSQPTVSYSLGKLRRHFGDQLFRPGRGGLAATALADRLYPSLRDTLATIDRTIDPETEFTPATSQVKFRLAMSDLGEASLLPLLVGPLRTAAPGVSLEIRPLDTAESPRELARGIIDGFIATPVLSSPHIRRIPVLNDDYRAMVATDHPRLTGSVTDTGQLRDEKYALADGPSGHIGPQLAIETLDALDRVAIRVTDFSTLPYVVQHSELVAIVPEFAGRTFAESHPVRLLRLPMRLEPLNIALYTLPEAARSHGQDWLVRFLLDTFRSVLPDG